MDFANSLYEAERLHDFTLFDVLLMIPKCFLSNFKKLVNKNWVFVKFDETGFREFCFLGVTLHLSGLCQNHVENTKR